MTTWHVTQGAGGGVGTPGDPWQTFANITWGVGGVVAGDTLQINGTYTSTGAADFLTIGDSGSSGSVITITGASTPVIDCNSACARGISGTNKDYITISNITIQNSTEHGISVGNCNNLTLDTVTVTACAQRGININNSSSVTLTSCNSSSNTQYGVFIDSTSSISTGITITNCTCSSNPVVNLRLAGWTAANALKNITVTGGTYNSSTNGGDNGLGIYFNIIENLTIDGVTCSSNNLGIWTDNVPQDVGTGNFDNTNTVIKNCTLVNNTHRAIYMFGHGHQIINNTATSPGTNGLSLIYSGGSDDNCIIANNTLTGAGASESNITINNGTHADSARIVECFDNSMTSGEFGILSGNSNSKTDRRLI
jgi:hypothetical protein